MNATVGDSVRLGGLCFYFLLFFFLCADAYGQTQNHHGSGKLRLTTTTICRLDEQTYLIKPSVCFDENLTLSVTATEYSQVACPILKKESAGAYSICLSGMDAGKYVFTIADDYQSVSFLLVKETDDDGIESANN